MSDGLSNTPGFNEMLWWIGQIADDSTWRDNQLPGKFKDAAPIPGWGYRYKVRIMGVHDQGPKDADPTPEDQLPWATVMYPVTAGGGQGSSSVTPNLRQGNIVFGYWMDGKDMQVPVIMGVLGNNSQTALAKKIGKAEDEGVSQTRSGSIAKSGYSKGEKEKKGNRKPKVPEKGLQTSKPTTKDIAKEAAALSATSNLDKFGLPASVKRTASQLQDIQSSTAAAQAAGLVGDQATSFIKDNIKTAQRNRVGAAQSPLTPPEKGAEIESADNPHRLTADDVKANDKANECIVTPMQQEDTVAAATKRIQIETDNLAAKMDKLLGARKNYIDAVSGPPSQEDIQKEVRSTACKIARYQKLIMDKVGEYQNKKMNQALTTVVAAMPSSMRYLFADQKFLNTQDATKKYNEMTNGMCDQMEGILTAAFDLPNLIKQADAEATSGALWADPNSQSAVSGLLDLGGGSGGSGSSDGSSGGGSSDVTQISAPNPNQLRTPKVPVCYAEDIIAQGIAVNRAQMSKIANDQHKNYNRFLEGMKSQLNKADQEMKDTAPDMSEVGKVTGISDEAPAAAYEPVGGSQYYSENGVPCTGGTGTGFKVDIVVPDGGWYDDSFATINDEGAGYTVNVANSGSTSGTGSTEGATTTGGSGSGIKVNYTIAGGKITGISTNTAGANYKNGDGLTIVNNASGTPSTNATFTVDKVRGTINRLSAGGIKIKDPGVGYKSMDVLVINQEGSGLNAAIMVTQVLDFGSAKATAGPVTPGDNQGANGKWVPPKPSSKPKVDIGQQLGDMLSMLGGMQGSMTQAFDFKNLMGNVFPFEPPPNTAVSDCYTLAKGGMGVPEVNKPEAFAIDDAISKVANVTNPVENLDFAIPSGGTPPINLASTAIKDVVDDAAAAADDIRDAINLY